MTKGTVKLTGNIPTIPRWRTVQNVGRFLKNPIKLIDQTMEEMGSTYLTYVGATARTIITKDPVCIRHVLQKNNKNYYKSAIQTENLKKYLGVGLFTSNGPYWFKQRRLMQPGFHKEKLNAIIDIMNQQIIDSLDEIHQRIKQGTTEFDIGQDMTALAMRIVARSLFSTGVSEDALETLSSAINELQYAIVNEIRQPMFSWWRALNGDKKKSLRIAEEARALILDLVETRKRSTKSHDDLLDMLIHAKYEDTGESMNNTQLLNEVLIVFIAGHETTANALTWALYNIQRSPHVLKKIKEEIDHFPSGYPTFKNIRDLSYTTQVISESLRMHPPLWLTDRVALADDKVGDFDIKKGDRLGLYVYGTHMCTSLWESPEKFDPDRFSQESVKKKPSYAYLPFGGGPRYCIGQQFAMMEMQLVIFHFVKRFNFSLVEGHEVEIEPLVTLRPKYGMKMRVENR